CGIFLKSGPVAYPLPPAAGGGRVAIGVAACRQYGTRIRGPDPIRQFRDNYHIAGRLMTLGWVLGWYCGLPNEGRRPADCRSESRRGPSAVLAAKPPGFAIHHPGCICRKAAGGSHPPQAACAVFIWFPRLGPDVDLGNYWRQPVTRDATIEPKP